MSTIGLQTSVWRLALPPENPEEALHLYTENQYIAVGWGQVGDLRQLDVQGPKDIEKALRGIPEYRGLPSLARGAQSLWDLWREIRPGDLVVLASHGSRVQVMEVLGDYEWVSHPELGDLQHRRRAIPVEMAPDELWERGDTRLTVGAPQKPLTRFVLPV